MSEIPTIVLSRIERFAAGVDLLRARAVEMEISPVPASFPNGAPDHSHRAYISLLVPFESSPPPSIWRRLVELGWRPEQEGEFWVFE